MVDGFPRWTRAQWELNGELGVVEERRSCAAECKKGKKGFLLTVLIERAPQRCVGLHSFS
jgi:hypothetical protein